MESQLIATLKAIERLARIASLRCMCGWDGKIRLRMEREFDPEFTPEKDGR